MSLKTRMGLLELARRYRVPILENDVYRELYLGERAMPDSLYMLDRHSLVINVSTFSKMLAPGLRIGWLTAPRYMIKQLALIHFRICFTALDKEQLSMALRILNRVLVAQAGLSPAAKERDEYASTGSSLS